MGFGPISGQELHDLVSSSEFADQCSAYISPTPGAALRLLESRFGLKPTAGGQNILGINVLRAALASTVEETCHLNGLMITAPHTHWQSGLPVIVSRTSDAYTIGPRSPDSCGMFVPISFTLTPFGPLPYEWADESIALPADEVSTIHTLILRASRLVADESWPLGFSLAFRFKGLFEPFSVLSIEYTPGDNPDDEASSVIIPMEELERIVSDPSHAQIGWHAFSDDLSGLSDSAINAIERLRYLAGGMSEASKRYLAKSLAMAIHKNEIS